MFALPPHMSDAHECARCGAPAQARGVRALLGTRVRRQAARSTIPHRIRALARLLSRRVRIWHGADAAAFWRFWLFWSFWLSIALFPAGYGLREIMPPLCLVFLLAYYRHAFSRSTLARLGRPAWLFLGLFGMVFIGVAFSRHPWASLLHAGTGLNKAYIAPFIAMECATSRRDLERLSWASLTACLWEGLDGLWQAMTGSDLIMGYGLNAGRLTGSLGDYTVGNYIALAIVPALGAWVGLARALGRARAALILAAMLWPAFYLLQGASSRSSLLAIAACPVLWYLLRRQPGRTLSWRAWAPVAIACACAFLFALCQPRRLGLDQLLQDGRWSLWELAWRVFLENPWLGAGAGQYNDAFRALGLSPARDAITISHPHDLYLDMLYAHGLVGFALGMIFLGGFLLWGWRILRPQLATPAPASYWQLAGCFWLAYAAWLVNGIFGHDFYRIWWLALAMSYLGIMIGACVNGPGPRVGAISADSGSEAG